MCNSKNMLDAIQEELNNAESEKYKKRLQGILYKYQGKSNNEISRLMGVSTQTVRNWIKCYETFNFEGLQEKDRSGRPRKLPPSIEKKIKKDLKASPKDFGYTKALWNQYIVQDHVDKIHKLKISPQIAHSVLQSTEIRVKKNKKMDVRERNERNNQFVLKLLEMKEDGYELWFADHMFLGNHAVGDSDVKFVKDHNLFYVVQTEIGEPIISSDVILKSIDHVDFLKYSINKVAKKTESTKVLLILHETKVSRKFTKIEDFYSGSLKFEVIYTPEKSFDFRSSELKLFEVLASINKGIKKFLKTNKPEKKQVRKELERLLKDGIPKDF